MSLLRLIALFVLVLLAGVLYADDSDDVSALLGKGRAEDALKSADRALESSPHDPRLRLLRGNALASMGRRAEAIQAFSSLINDMPALPEPYNNLAAVYAEQGDLEKARLTLQKALHTNPSYGAAETNLNSIYAMLAAQSYDKAIERDVVEKHHGQSAAPVAAPTVSQLLLVPDLAGGKPPVQLAGHGVTGTIASAGASKPVQIALAPVKNIVPVEAQPASSPRIPVMAQTQTLVESPHPAAAEKRENSVNDGARQVENVLNEWAAAWSAKRVSVYLAVYAPAFKPAGMSRATWEQQRRERIEAARRIEVKLSKIRIRIDGSRASVHFVQRYKSDRLDTSTGKSMVLEKNGNHWQIVQEQVG